jgi:hypothetical protein
LTKAVSTSGDRAGPADTTIHSAMFWDGAGGFLRFNFEPNRSLLIAMVIVHATRCFDRSNPDL